MRNLILLLIMAMLAFSCTENKPSAPVQDDGPIVVTPKPEPIPAEEYKYKWKNAKWTKILEDAIRFSKLANMPAKDWKQFHFKKNIGTIEEWAKVMVEMAYWESKFKPEATYKENFRNSKGQYIYSRGLFMLSKESGNGYGCGFVSEKDVNDVKKNIECAVKIMERWLIRDGVIHTDRSPYRGGARYWAVLRCNRDYTCKSLKAIKEANK